MQSIRAVVIDKNFINDMVEESTGSHLLDFHLNLKKINRSETDVVLGALIQERSSCLL